MAKELVLAVVAFFSSFAIALVFIPFLIKKMTARNLVGTDMNKFYKPAVAELGGIGVLFGLIFGVMMSLGIDSFFSERAISLTPLLAAFSTVLIIGLLGIVDD